MDFRLWLASALLLVAPRVWGQPPLAGSTPDIDQIDKALQEYFRLDASTRESGLLYIGAERVGPSFGIPSENSAQTRVLLDRLANPAIRAPLTIETVDSVYEYILQFRQLPGFRYSRQDQATLKRSGHILFKRRFLWSIIVDWLLDRHPPRKPSRFYTRYFEIAMLVAQAKDDLKAAQASHADATKIGQIKAQIEHLTAEWQTKGEKDRVEWAMSEYSRITEKNPSTIWKKVQAQYDNNSGTIAGRKLPKTNFSPKVADWRSDADWELVTVPGTGGIPPTRLRIKRIQLARPWLDDRVFGDLPWTWIRTAPLGAGHVVSDGKGLDTTMTMSKTISLIPRQIVVATYAGNNNDWPRSGFVAGYLASVVPITPIR